MHRVVQAHVDISRLARLLGLGLMLFLPSAAHAPSLSAGLPWALAPAEILARGFLQPRGVVVDSQGVVYVSDRATGTITSIASDWSTAVVARGLERPIGLAFDLEGRLLVAEERAGRVVRLETDGTRTPLVSGVKQPRWLDVGEDGTLFIAARRLTRGTDPEPDDESAEPEVILSRDPTGALTLFADGFRGLRAVVAGDRVLYAAAAGRRGEVRDDGVVYRIPILPDGHAGVPTPLGPLDSFKNPVALAQDRLGALFLTTRELNLHEDRTRRAIAKLHQDGHVSSFADGLDQPQGLAFDAAGNLYIADGVSPGRVLRFRAPPAPELSPLPAVTNEPSIQVRGITQPQARVDSRIDGRDTLFTTQGDPGGQFALTIPLAPNTENTLEVFATARGGEGLTGPPAEVTVRHDDVPPETAITGGPGSPTSESTARFTFTGTDDVTPPDTLRFAWRLDSQPFSAFSSEASAAFTDLADGAHTFEVVAQDQAGNVDPTPATQMFTASRFQVTLVEPAPGATVLAGLRLVRGAVAAGGREIGVTVNGVAAAVHGNTFAAFVPVSAATTNLQIVTTTAAGTTASQEVPVTVASAPDSPFVFLASPWSGVAPLTVSFTLLGVSAPATVEADFDGNGRVDYTGQRLEGQAFTYAQPGLYFPLVAVTDAQGQRTTVPAVIQVFDRAVLDTLLKAKWASMKDALRRGDIPQALTHVAVRSRTRYQQAFTTLIPDLPTVDSILSDLTFIRVRGLETIFEMNRTDAAILKSFEVRFQVDSDGLWRLRSF